MSEIVQNQYSSWQAENSAKFIYNGFIYVGQVDTDPLVEANQVRVYYIDENEQEVNLTQPIRTNSSGFPVISETNSTVIQIRTSSDYSVKVLNKKGTQEWYIPKASTLSPILDINHNNTKNRSAANAHDDIYTRNFKSTTDLRSQTDAAGNVLDFTDFPQGTRFYWQGYYSPSDGGSNWGVLKFGDSSSLVDDGGSIFIIVNDAVNGAWIEANITRKINVRKFGARGNGIDDDRFAFVNVHNADAAAYVPDGTYRINSGIDITSGAFTVSGNGPTTNILCAMSDYLFKFPEETGRSVKKFSDFSVISSGSMSSSGVVFLFDGTGTGGDLKYTSGYKFENIEVGGGGEFACIWDLTDTFRTTIRDCGYTGVTNPVRIRGSVVQCTIDNLTGNNTDFVRSYKGENAGVYMQVRSDYSDSTTRVPENVKVMNCGFVNHRRGMLSVGLAVTSENNDFDFIRDVGFDYGGGNGHNLTGGYIAHASGDNDFIGVRVRRASDLEAVDIDKVTINAYSTGTANQTAVQIGDGNVSPFAETAGVTVSKTKIFGPANSWNFGIQADRNRRLTINGNRIAAGVIKSGGYAINASNSKNLTCTSNACNGQGLYVSAPVSDSVGTVTDNECVLTQEFISGTFEIDRNRPVIS